MGAAREPGPGVLSLGPARIEEENFFGSVEQFEQKGEKTSELYLLIKTLAVPITLR